MPPNKSQFFDKAPLVHPIFIYTADRTLMPVSHKGTIFSPCLSLSDTFYILKCGCAGSLDGSSAWDRCRHRILYTLRPAPSFHNDGKILKPKVGLGPDQIIN